MPPIVTKANMRIRALCIGLEIVVYCVQLGRLKECQKWLKKAMLLDDRTAQQGALDDPYLKPLWDRMGALCGSGQSSGRG